MVVIVVVMIVADLFTNQSLLLGNLFPGQVDGGMDVWITGLGAVVDEQLAHLFLLDQEFVLDRGFKFHKLWYPSNLFPERLLQQSDQLTPPFQDQGFRVIQDPEIL